MDKLHVIHSSDGKIGPGRDTTPEDLDAIVTAAAQHPSHHLILHFHGGLVSKADGLANAGTMIEAYEGAGYPVFFVWESDWWKAMRGNLEELRDEPAVQGLKRKILFWALEKVGAGFWKEASDPAALVADDAELALRAEAAKAALDADEVEADMAADAEFRLALCTLPGLSVEERAELGVNPLVGESETAVATILSEQLHGSDFLPGGGRLLLRTAWYVITVVRKVFERRRTGRDHGRQATCMEELARAIKLGGADLGEWGRALEWNRMKKDTRDAFETSKEAVPAGPELHAGTALLMRLGEAIAAKRLQLDRITLVGHSAGSIYVANWLRHCGDYLPKDLKHDLVFLAPAISYADFADLLDQHADRIGKFRMFAMRDDLEIVDQVIGNDMEIEHQRNAARALYPSSLLYLVSGLLETRLDPKGKPVEDPDKPLLGMQRFATHTRVFNDADFPEIKKVKSWLDSPDHTIVWSVSEGQPEGFNCPCYDHGTFGGARMIPTLKHIVSAGF